MAGTPIYISDFNEAIDNGTIPGKFNADRTKFIMPVLSNVGSKGQTLNWTIIVSLVLNDKEIPIEKDYLNKTAKPIKGSKGKIITETYQISASGVKGNIRKNNKPTFITTGKNIGKLNETNVITQALRDALGKYNSQMKHKGLTVAAELNDITTEVQKVKVTAKQPPPMLVKKLNETKSTTLGPAEFMKGLTVQRKYNGVRVVAYLAHGEVILYGRKGLDYPGFDHLREELKPLLEYGKKIIESAKFPEINNREYLLYLDGEIYKHGKSLRWISGQSRREDDDANLEYIVYDCFFLMSGEESGIPSKLRQQFLDNLFETKNKLIHIIRAENFPVRTMDEIDNLFNRFIKEGYEGAIVRKDWAKYKYGTNNYHSSNLVKIKPIYDAEFKVVDYAEGEKGKDKGAIIWICEVDKEHIVDENDKYFTVVPKDMTYKERYRLFELMKEKVDNNSRTFFEKYVKGLHLTVEFPERSSKTGKPTQAKALAFRIYEGETNEGIKRMFPGKLF